MGFGAGVEGLDDDDLRAMDFSTVFKAVSVPPLKCRVHPRYQMEWWIDTFFPAYLPLVMIATRPTLRTMAELSVKALR